MKKQKLILSALFLCSILFSCNHEIVLKNPPAPDDYFVFDGLLEEMEIFGAQVLKVQTVTADSVRFLIPEIELAFEFDPEKDEKLVKERDEKGKMYQDKTISVSKKDLATYEDNFENDKEGVALIAVFY